MHSSMRHPGKREAARRLPAWQQLLFWVATGALMFVGVFNAATASASFTKGADGTAPAADAGRIGGDGTRAHQTAFEQTFTPVFTSNVGIVKAAAGTGGAGQPLTYTLVFSNAGPGTAVGVVITDLVPAALQSPSVSSSGAALTPRPGPNFSWDVGSLASGAGGIITISGSIDAAATKGFVINNTAVIAGTGPDSNPANNSSSAPVTVSCGAHITVTNANDSGAGSLRQAMLDICAGGLIDFSSNFTIILDSTLPGVTQDVTVRGPATLQGGSGCFTSVVRSACFGPSLPSAFDAFLVSGGTLNVSVLNITNFINALHLTGAGAVVNASYNRITGNTTGLRQDAGVAHAQNNWWGCNGGPNAPGCDTTVATGLDVSPWLILELRRKANYVASDGTQTLTGSLQKNSNGVNMAPAGTVPDGINMLYATNIGQINGGATATLPSVTGQSLPTYAASGASGTATVTLTVDNQSVTTSFIDWPGTAPTFITPTGGISVTTRLPSYQWTAVADATNYKLVVRSGSQAGPILQQKSFNTPPGSLPYLAPSIAPRGTHIYWSVTACAPIGCSAPATADYILDAP